MKVVVIGAQWGDEGKGKIVDYLAEDAEYVVRYAGGPNAGHTIVVDGKQFALHQVPSGILYPNKSVFLGAGMVIDPEALFNELQMLKDNGINWEGRVFISDRAHIILPRYRKMDKERDSQRKRPIGTTGRGIGIAYSEKSQRDGIRLADLDWKQKMDEFEGEDLNSSTNTKTSLSKCALTLLKKCTNTAKATFFLKVRREQCSTLTQEHILMFLQELHALPEPQQVAESVLMI